MGISYSKGQVIQETYIIQREIGEGGAGVVYLAYHMRLQKYVVLKRIKDIAINSLDSRAEVDMLKGLHHKYLPQVYDFFQEGSEVFTVLDYIDGNDLAYYINNQITVPEDLVTKWLIQLSEVLEYLHSNNPPIYHSDIKPSNIIITPDLDVCLIDFNISMSDSTDYICGITPAYASPEQMYLKEYLKTNHGYVKLDQRMDIYGLGATFFHLMTGVRPDTFPAGHADFSIMPEIYRKSLVSVIKKAMSENPSDRFRTASDMKKSLVKTTSEYKVRIIRITLVSAIAAILVLGALGIGLLMYRSSVEEKEAECIRLYNEIVNEYNHDDYEPEELRVNIQNTFFNDREYAGFLEKNPDCEARLYFITGYTYFVEGDYESALKNYEKALSYDEESGEVLRELSVVCSRMDDYRAAESYLQRAKDYLKDKYDVNLMYAELSLAKGDIPAVNDYVSNILKENTPEEIILRSAVVSSMASGEQEDYEDFINLFGHVQLKNENRYRLERLLLNACLYQGDKYKESPEGDTYNYEALGYGRSLCNSSSHTAADEIALAETYCRLDMYEEAKTMLLSSSYIEKDYRIYMWLAKISAEASSDGSVSPDAREYYRKAKELPSYKSAESKGEIDDIMRQLGDYVGDE